MISIRKRIHTKLLLFFISLAVVTVAGLYYFVFPRFGWLFPKCPLFVMTHLYCPGCGSQRCLAALLHGHIGDAFHQNCLTIAALPAIFYRVYLLAKQRTIADTIFVTKAMPRITLAVVVVFVVLRNIPIAPFTWLAPY